MIATQTSNPAKNNFHLTKLKDKKNEIPLPLRYIIEWYDRQQHLDTWMDTSYQQIANQITRNFGRKIDALTVRKHLVILHANTFNMIPSEVFKQRKHRRKEQYIKQKNIKTKNPSEPQQNPKPIKSVTQECPRYQRIITWLENGITPIDAWLTNTYQQIADAISTPDDKVSSSWVRKHFSIIIAGKLDINPSEVIGYKKVHRKEVQKQMTPEKIRQLIKMRRKKIPVAIMDCARQLNMSPLTIATHCKRLGLDDKRLKKIAAEMNT